MEKYLAPEMKVVEFGIEDIVTASNTIDICVQNQQPSSCEIYGSIGTGEPD